MVGFKAVEFSPDQPDEMGVRPKGVVLANAGGGGITCGNVNDFVLSLLAELGTMGSKRGSWGDPLLYQLVPFAWQPQ